MIMSLEMGNGPTSIPLIYHTKTMNFNIPKTSDIPFYFYYG
jgi:hypothetical protein